GGLVVERRVGGGRIAVTRFSLTDVRIRHWRNFDNFFNAVLLRRPPRQFDGRSDQVTVRWADVLLSDMMYEPRISSTLRYFTRDIAPLVDGMWSDEAPAIPRPQPTTPYPMPGRRGVPFYDEPREMRPETAARQPDLDDWRLAGYQSNQPSGV